MTSQCKIIEVLNTKIGSDNQGLVFKVEWTDSHQIAYMQFDMAKRKYPLVVLEYLSMRIKKKSMHEVMCQPDGLYKKQQNLVTQHSQINFACSHELKQIRLIDKFFSQCLFCESRKTSSKILDCDSIIPFDTNLAYAVHFKLTKNKRKDAKKGRLSTKSNTTISKIESEVK